MLIMLITKVNAEVLRAALVRNGIWFVNLNGESTVFYHKACYNSREILRVADIHRWPEDDTFDHEEYEERYDDGYNGNYNPRFDTDDYDSRFCHHDRIAHSCELCDEEIEAAGGIDKCLNCGSYKTGNQLDKDQVCKIPCRNPNEY